MLVKKASLMLVARPSVGFENIILEDETVRGDAYTGNKVVQESGTGNGDITDIRIINSGSNYTSPPVITVNSPSETGSGAKVLAFGNDIGKVLGLKVVEPITYPVPASSIINSDKPPLPIALTWMIAPSPPPVIITLSFSALNIPSFVIDNVPGIPEVVALINDEALDEAVPLISSPVWKAPVIVSPAIVNSVISFAPIWNFETASTNAVAPEVWPVIVLPIKSVKKIYVGQ